MSTIIKEKSLKPFYLVHANCLSDLTAREVASDISNELNCVVVGDAVDEFSYKNMNKAFQTIMKNDCSFYSLGKGRYYQEDGELVLDVGPFVAALEFATSYLRRR